MMKEAATFSAVTASRNSGEKLHDNRDSAPSVASLTPATTIPTAGTSKSTTSNSIISNKKPDLCNLTDFPFEIQFSILTYLRATDLSCLQQTCKLYTDRKLIHSIVDHTAQYTYPHELTKGFEQEPVLSSEMAPSSSSSSSPIKEKGKGKGKGKRNSKANTNNNMSTIDEQQEAANGLITNNGDGNNQHYYTLEHLRNMELLVVVRALSRPEPSTIGNNFYVSKSWCRTALRWLEVQQEQREEKLQQRLQQQQQQQQQQQISKKQQQQNKHRNKAKKLSKKQQRLRQRKVSDASPPWPNVNSDLLCGHEKLQHVNSKSARARRRLMDKQAWKCLKKLYPDSTQLFSLEGECIQCRLEMETAKRNEQDLLEQEKIKRKQPLSDPIIRRFYTRTRGVPLHCCYSNNNSHPSDSNGQNDEEEVEEKEQQEDTFDCKPPAVKKDEKCPAKDHNNSCRSVVSTSGGRCPLIPGIYYVIPRAWCHSWRKYIKTGEGGPILAPDASGLLCPAHRLSLLPPHLEAYLHGETSHLFLASSSNEANYSVPIGSPGGTVVGESPQRQQGGGVVGQLNVNDDSFRELMATGMPLHEVASQHMAMMNLELRQQEMNRRQRQQQQPQGQGQDANAAGGDATNDGNNHNNSCTSAESNNDRLDRENHTCVEIVTQEEWLALEKLFPHHSFGLSFAVTSSSLPSSSSSSSLSLLCTPTGKQQHQEKTGDDGEFAVCGGTDSSFLDNNNNDEITYSTLPCRDCDPSGLASNSSLTIRNRRKRWLKKVTDAKSARSPVAKLEY